jgi:hypothetical protein
MLNYISIFLHFIEINKTKIIFMLKNAKMKSLFFRQQIKLFAAQTNFKQLHEIIIKVKKFKGNLLML